VNIKYIFVFNNFSLKLYENGMHHNNKNRIELDMTIVNILCFLLSYPSGKNSIYSREIVQYRTMDIYADTREI
jgi:hypothetical protein